MHELKSFVGWRSEWMKELMKVFYGGLGMRKEWKVVRLLKEYIR